MAALADTRYAPEVKSPAAARTFVLETLERWSCHGLAEIACLLTSELVTNAVLHAGSEVGVHLALEGGRLRVEIEDGSDKLPTRKPGRPLDDGGRGLHIVGSLSDTWGVRSLPGGGKVVWFELSRGSRDGYRPSR